MASNKSYLTTPVRLQGHIASTWVCSTQRDMSQMKFIPQSSNATLAISKPPMLSLLTNIGSNSTALMSWNVSDSLFTSHENLVDILSCNTVQADENGGVYVQAFFGMPQVGLSSNIQLY